jgi:hypothetical protein
LAGEEELVPAAAEAEGDASIPELYRPGLDVPLDEVEEGQLPSLKVGAGDDSFGWLQVEPEEDYYSGWSTEEEAEGEEPERIRKEFEEIEESRTPAKKRGKKRGRQDRRGSQPTGSRRDQQRGRSRS